MSVCLSLQSYISKYTRQNFTIFSVPVTCGRDSIFLDDSIVVLYEHTVMCMTSCFNIMEQVGQNQRWRVCFVKLCSGGTGAKCAVSDFLFFSQKNDKFVFRSQQ